MTEAQREKTRIYQRRWRAEHPKYREYHRLYQRQWCKDNPDKVRAIAKRYREKTKRINGRFLCIECGQRFYADAVSSGGFRKFGNRIGICRDCHSSSIEIGPGLCAIWKRLGIEDPLLKWFDDDRIRPEEIPHSASTSLWMTIPEAKLRELI